MLPAPLHNLCMAALWDRIDSELTRRNETWADLGRVINASDQTMHNWKKRGAVPASRHKAIADALGWSVDSMLSEDWAPTQHPSGPPENEGVGQELSDLKPDHELIPKPWEFVLSAVILPKRFCVAVPDGALAPKSPKGTEFVFVSPPQGQPGESVAVIVQTASGQRCMRLYFATGGGAWEARSRDPAFPSYHSDRDGLQLLAVATMRSGGEG